MSSGTLPYFVHHRTSFPHYQLLYEELLVKIPPPHSGCWKMIGNSEVSEMWHVLSCLTVFQYAPPRVCIVRLGVQLKPYLPDFSLRWQSGSLEQKRKQETFQYSKLKISAPVISTMASWRRSHGKRWSNSWCQRVWRRYWRWFWGYGGRFWDRFYFLLMLLL